MEWLTKAWSFIKTHKKKVAAILTGIVAALEAFGYTGMTGYLTKILGFLGTGTPTP